MKVLYQVQMKLVCGKREGRCKWDVNWFIFSLRGFLTNETLSKLLDGKWTVFIDFWKFTWSFNTLTAKMKYGWQTDRLSLCGTINKHHLPSNNFAFEMMCNSTLEKKKKKKKIDSAQHGVWKLLVLSRGGKHMGRKVSIPYIHKKYRQVGIDTLSVLRNRYQKYR